jgi:hypothetical protein
MHERVAISARRVCAGALVLVLVALLVVAAPAASDAAPPTLKLSPASGPIGTKVTVSLCDMTPGDTIVAGNITFGGGPWNPRDIPIDSTGCMCATVLTVPVAAEGPNPVVVISGNVTVAGVFTVIQPSMAIYPSTGYKGQMVTVTGAGWPQRTPGAVSITFAGELIAIATPDDAGSFSVQFEVPITAGATNVVSASDIRGNVAPAKLFVVSPPGLTVSPNIGYPGTTALVTGVGFEPFSSIDVLKIADFELPTYGLATNEVGTFWTTITIPSLPGGGQVVMATVAGKTLSTCYTILDPDVWRLPDAQPLFPMEQCIDTIGDNLVRIWGYYAGEWRMYDPDDVLGSNLPGLVSGRGYWVRVSDPCSMVYRQLQAGWNNIGW